MGRSLIAVRTLARRLILLLAWIPIVVAIILVAMRLALPRWVGDPQQVQAAAERYLGLPVAISSSTLTWNGWQPVVTLREVALHDPEVPGRVLLAAGEARAELDLLASIRGAGVVLEQIVLDRFDLVLELGTDGVPRLLPADSESGTVSHTAGADVLGAWLGRLGELRLSRGGLRLRSGDPRIPPQGLDDVTLRLGAAMDGRQMRLEGRLRGSTETRVSGFAEWFTGVADGAATGHFHLAVEGLQSAALDNWLILPPGQIDASVWGALSAASTPDLRGILRWSVSGEPAITTAWAWQPDTESGWTAQGTLTQGGGAPAHWRIRSEAPWLQDGPWTVELRDLDLAAVAPLVAQAGPGLVGVLADTVAQGRVSQARVDFRGGSNPWLAIARVEGLHTRADGRLPAVAGLGGELRWDGHTGELRLAGGPLSVDLPGLLRAPLAISRADGALTIRPGSDGGWQLASNGLLIANTELEALFRGSATIDDDPRSPWLDLQVGLSRLEVAAVHRYLPAHIMEPGLVSWLQHSLVSGAARWGELRLRGWAADFPYDGAPGHFHARLQLQDMILDFDPEWPRLEEFEAELQFAGPGLHVYALGGALGPMPVESVEARVPRLDRRLLSVDATLAGTGEQLMETIAVSPVLARELAPRLEPLTLAGSHRLHLGLMIPIDDPDADVAVTGRLEFGDGDLVWMPWGLRLAGVSGDLDFDAGGLVTGALNGHLGGVPIRLSVLEPGETASGRITRLALAGRFSIQALAGSLTGQTPDLSWAEGAAGWTALITIEPDGGAPELEMLSDLEGIALELPTPLGKSAQSVLPLRIALQPTAGGGLAVAAECGVLSARLQLAGMPSSPRVQAADIRLDAGAAQWPQENGVTVRGHLEQLDLDPLLGIWTAGAVPLRELALTVGDIRLGDLSFPDVALQARQEGDGIRFHLQGAYLAGEGYVPHSATVEQPVRLSLELLDLRWADDAAADVSRQSGAGAPDMPPLQLQATDFRLNGESLGSLTLGTQPVPGGFIMDRLDIEAGDWRLSGQAEWRGAAGQQRAGVSAVLRSADLGHTLAVLGFEPPLTDGDAVIEAVLSWAGPLWSPDFATLQGETALAVEQGALLEVRPGVGRVLGVLNIESLSRRLRLDFSDVFRDRLTFDSIGGQLRFGDGQMTTDDLFIDSPAAHIRIAGRAGLIARDYDQVVTVTPRVSVSLPIAGALAGGPAVGAALFLAERVFQGEIDQMVRRRYHLGGTWDAPEVRLLVDDDGEPEQAPGTPGWDP